MRLVQIQEFANKYHKILLLISLLFVFVVDMYVISQRPLRLSDGVSSTWWMIIRNVESGNGYKACADNYIPNCNLTDRTTAMREPVPVFFFVLLGKLTQNSTLAFQLSQLVFNMLIGWFVYLLATELGNRTLGLVAAFGWAVYLHAVHTLMHINGDLMGGFFVIAGVLCLTRAIKNGRLRDWLLFGLLFGLAVLSRSSVLLVFGVLTVGSAIFLWPSARLQQEWRQLLLAMVLFGLVLSPWVIRNEIVFGKPIFGTTLVGYNLYRYNAIASREVPPHYVGPTEGYQEVQALVARTPELQLPVNEARVDEIYQQEALKIIRSHFEEYVELVAVRPIPLWFNIGIPDQYGEKLAIFDILIVIQQAILLIMFIIAIWKGDWYLRLLAAGVLFFMFGYLAVDSQLRYMVTVMPLTIAVSVVGMEGFIRTAFINRPLPLFQVGKEKEPQTNESGSGGI
jgi:4-amino-4-deoxy-L-arabinose transferase-like glycosyltransferase